MRITTLLALALAGALAFICIRIVGQPDPAPATIRPPSPPITEEAETSVAHPSPSATERSPAQQLDKSFQLAVSGAPDGDWVQVLSSGDPGDVHLESVRVHGGMISIRNSPSSLLAAISETVGVGWTTRSPDGSVDRLVFSDRSSIRVTNPDEAVRGELFQASAVGANERQAVRDSATCRRIWSLAAEDGTTRKMTVGRDFLRRLSARDPAIHRALSVERPRAGGKEEEAGLVATCLAPGPYRLVTSSRSGWVFSEPSGHAASIGGDSSGPLSLDGSELQPPPLTTVVSLEGGQEAPVSVRRRSQASIHGNLDDLGPMDSAHVTLSRFVIRNASKESSGIATYKVLESATLQRGEAYAFHDLDVGDYVVDAVARWGPNQFSIVTSRVAVTESREYENDLSLDHVRSLEVFLVDDPSLTAGLPDGATLRVSLAARSKTFEGQSLFEVPWRVRSGPLRLRGLREGAYAVTCSGWPLGDAEATWHFSDALNAATPATGDARVQYAPGRQVTK